MFIGFLDMHGSLYCCTGCNQGKQIIADFIKQKYPPEEIRADILCKVLFIGQIM
jgi:hypothetical protein